MCDTNSYSERLLKKRGWVFSSDNIKKRKIPFLRRKIGMIFQDYHLLRDRNLFENIALPLYVIGTRHSDISERVEDVIDLVGLTGKEEHSPDELSGGEQQRACIARALVKNLKLFLLMNLQEILIQLLLLNY